MKLIALLPLVIVLGLADTALTPKTSITLGWALSGMVVTVGVVWWAARDRQKIEDRLKHIEKKLDKILNGASDNNRST